MDNHLYLAHHGIKGQKWGVRRFRDENGKLTEAGKKRYSNDLDLGYRDDTGALTKTGLSRTSVTTNQGGKIVSGSQNAVRGIREIYGISNTQPRNRYNTRANLTQEEMNNMSDKDLRDLVNRLNLEQQYSQLTQDKVARSRVEIGLDYAEAALTVVGSAVSVYGAWRLLSNN